MKIVQSLGSCNQNDLLRFSAGWYAPEYHLMSWALSCLQLTKYYSDVVLHADSVTAKMLIDTLQLPYRKVICDLDILNSYHYQLWALPKIHTYSKQRAPFLHVDGDVIIWKPFDEELLKGQLIAQNVERATAYYENMMRGLKAGLKYIPQEIIIQENKNEVVCSYNAGIFGGNDVAFFNLYANKAKEFIYRNAGCFSTVDVDAFNILFEQYLFHSMARQHNKNVSVLFDDVIGDNEYIGLGDFSEVPYNKNYLHLIGTYKRNKRVCEQLANRLRQDYPEYYYRIIALFKNRPAPLKKDYYYFLGQMTEQHLTARSASLQAAYYKNGIPVFDHNNGPAIRETAFNIKLFQNAILTARHPQPHAENNHPFEQQLNDVIEFENKLNTILKTKFSTYSNEYLYARDIAHTQYFEFLFADPNTSYNKKLVADPIIEIVESKFDWSELVPDKASEMKWMQQVYLPPSGCYTAVIPECDLQGYSLINIDELDLLIIRTLQMPISISELLNGLKPAFDPDELEASPAEFELLITGRIKMALQSKLIKALIV